MSAFATARKAYEDRRRGYRNRATRDKQANIVELAAGTRNSAQLANLLGQMASNQRAAFNYVRNWVYVCQYAIARRIAAQPWCAGEIIGAPENPDRASVNGFTTKGGDWIKRAQLHERLWERATTADMDLSMLPHHPALDVLAHPNRIQHKREFLMMTSLNISSTGEAYWIADTEDTEDGEKLRLYAIPTHNIEPVHDGELYSSYLLRMSTQGEAIPLPAENVVRIYDPDGARFGGAMSPLMAILDSIKTDDEIQRAQRDMMERGINPNLIVTVGKQRGRDGKQSDRRPRLSGPQRRQLIRAIREIWNNTVNAGDPAIVDGFIESIHKLQLTPQEMDFLTSGNITKERIFSAYGVNPYMVGQVTGLNKAQAVVAEYVFCSNVANPLLSACSDAATTWIGPMYDRPARLELWLEPCEPTDNDVRQKQLETALREGAITKNEYRSEIGYKPLEDEEKADRAAILDTVGGAQAAVAFANALGTSVMSRDQYMAHVMLFFQVTRDQAEAMAGSGVIPAAPAPTPQNLPAPEDNGDDLSDDAVQELEDDPDSTGRSAKSAEKSELKTEWRKAIQCLHIKQLGQQDKPVKEAMSAHIRKSVRETAKRMRQREDVLDADNAAAQAAAIVQEIFPLRESQDTLRQDVGPPLMRAFIEGASLELSLNRMAQAGLLSGVKETTAEEIARRLGIVAPYGVEFGELPDWLRDAAIEHLDESFQQEWWLEIDATTADDIQRTIETGIVEGKSIRKIAQEITSKHGSAYSLARATLVARTELPDVLNAGHSAGILQLQEETGMLMTKVYVSVFGPTTRDDHANADGQEVPADGGMFDIGGELAPWPGHWSLSAGQRCNCQCTVISGFLEESLA